MIEPPGAPVPIKPARPFHVRWRVVGWMAALGLAGLTVGSAMVASSIDESMTAQPGLGPYILLGIIGCVLGGLVPLGGTYMKHHREISDDLKADLTTFGLTLTVLFLLVLMFAAMANWHHVGTS